MTPTRRLAAIMAADVAGFSAAMERDEEGTFAQVREMRRKIVEPKIKEHTGRLVKTTGDGFLAEFASPIAAMRCALAIQAEAARAPLQLRIGLNLGDVIVEENGDVYGDGVNVAARLEALADAGGILISGKVHGEVEGKVEAAFEDRGERRVKNIARPVRIYATRIVSGGVTAKTVSAMSGDVKALPLPDKPSIAVLPFQNMSGDPEQEYFTDGMVEDIITALSRFKSLFVIARNSSFTYKGKAVDIKKVGRELGVRYVLEGSVRKAGGHVRITGQLIEAETGAHLWADHFDGALQDIFDLQDRVTVRAVSAIAPRLQQAEYERSKRKPTESLGAYDYYLRGIALSAHPTKEENDEALHLFTKAIERDPEFAAPYARAALCYAARRGWGWDVDPDREASEAIRLARTAIRLGADDASVLGVGGFVIAYLYDLEGGADYVDRARALNPNIHWGAAGWISTCLGRPEIAITQLTNAMRYSPFDPALVYWRFWMAQAHFFARHDDEAIAWMKMALQLLPDNPTLLRVLAVCLASAGHIEEAKDKVSQANRVDPKPRAFFNSFQGTPLRRAEDRKRVAEGLRLAGLPE